MKSVPSKLAGPKRIIARGQKGFREVEATLVRHPKYPAPMVQIEGHAIPRELNAVVLCFRPSDVERAQLAAGEDLYIAMLTFMQPMQGINVYVGPEVPAAVFKTDVEG